VIRHVFDFVRGVDGGNRNRNRADLLQSEICHHPLDAVLQVNDYRVVVPNPNVKQCSGETIYQLFQLREGIFFSQVDDSGMVRDSLAVLLETREDKFIYR
jgi:hypothetical protein